MVNSRDLMGIWPRIAFKDSRAVHHCPLDLSKKLNTSTKKITNPQCLHVWLSWPTTQSKAAGTLHMQMEGTLSLSPPHSFLLLPPPRAAPHQM